MKLLTILTATVFSLAVIAPFPTDACSGTAGASAWVTSNTSTAFSSINANNAKSGGYSLSCTGNSSKYAETPKQIPPAKTLYDFWRRYCHE